MLCRRVYIIQRISGVDNASPIRHTDPNVLRRATLKIDFYLIPHFHDWYVMQLCLLSLPLHIAHLAHYKIFCPI